MSYNIDCILDGSKIFCEVSYINEKNLMNQDWSQVNNRLFKTERKMCDTAHIYHVKSMNEHIDLCFLNVSEITL